MTLRRPPAHGWHRHVQPPLRPRRPPVLSGGAAALGALLAASCGLTPSTSSCTPEPPSVSFAGRTYHEVLSEVRVPAAGPELGAATLRSGCGGSATVQQVVVHAPADLPVELAVLADRRLYASDLDAPEIRALGPHEPSPSHGR